jgi:hypothetical protein
MVKVSTKNPQGLLNSIYKAIDSKKIETWTYNSSKDLTHSPTQWKNKAVLRPSVHQGELRLCIRKYGELEITDEVYAVYHGRSIEMLISHFEDDFTTAEATAKPQS